MREMKIHHPTPRERGLRLDAILGELDGAVGERLGVEGTRRPYDALDVLGELRFRPHDPIDPEGAATARAEVEKILARDEADRLRAADLPRHCATDDVDLVEAGAGDEQVGTIDARARQDLLVRAGAQQKLNVERLESIPNLGRVIDDEHLVLR
jgi:hypothetical protein